MTNRMQYCGGQALGACEDAPVERESDITAVALLKLLMRAEAASATAIAEAAPVSEFGCRRAEPVPINDSCDAKLVLNPYLREQLKTITDAVFNRVNGDFYRAYRGLAPEQMSEIILSKEDLRPLAYRALMYEGPASERPFAPCFAASLLLLQTYWDCDFFQTYKDVGGRLSAHSLKRAPGRF